MKGGLDIELKENQSEIKLLSQCFDYVKNLQDKDKYPEYNLSLYTKIMEILVPRFTSYIVTELPTDEKHPIPISSRYPLDTKEAYKIKLQEGAPFSTCRVAAFSELSTKKMRIKIKRRTTIHFSLLNSEDAPVSFAEALFTMGHEIAHIALAHPAKNFYMTELSHRREYDYRWYLNRMYIPRAILWQKESANMEFEADLLSVKVGGLQALQGGITLIVRNVIESERIRNSWCTYPSYLLVLGTKLQELEDRLINLLRIWKILSLSSVFAAEYYKLIDDMPDWQESRHRDDQRIKKKLHNFVQKAEDVSLKIPSNYTYGFFSKTVIPLTAIATTGIPIGIAAVKCMGFD